MIIEYVGFFAYLCTVHKLLTIIGIFLCLVLLGCKDQQNQEDSLMTNDTLAIGLCDYFDGRGTPNERMLAHYILARTYVDMNEIPQALEELQKAVASADTTAADCDQRLLARVHRQASLLKEQSSGASHLYLWLLIGGFVVLCVGAMSLLRRKKTEKVEVDLPQEVMAEETSVYEKMTETEAYLRFKDLSKHPQQSIRKEDWTSLEAMVDEYLPDFRKKVDPSHSMKDADYRICMLIRLRFSPSEIAVFLDITLQNLYSRRKQLLSNVFHVIGKPQEFDQLIQEL
jgi:hypothetical protein